MLRWRLILCALAGAFLCATAHAGTICYGPVTVTSNTTIPSVTTPWSPDVGEFQNPDAWLTVVDAGSGSGGPTAVVNVYAPNVTGTTNRAYHRLDTMSGATTYVGRGGSAGGINATVANCTACTVTLTFCGEVTK